jgi:hypothetical protein
VVISKIVIDAGQIDNHQELLPKDMDPILLRRAEEVLALLRTGTPSVSNPIPAGPQMAVVLGSPRNSHAEKRARERWQDHNPEGDLAQYEIECQQWELERRRTGFYVTYRGVSKSYNLIARDIYKHDGGLYGLVIGSSLGTRRLNQESEEERENQQKQITETVRQCVALRPAFIAPSAIMDDRSSFADHFAVAMLLSDLARDE